MDKLRLSIGIGNYDRVRPLADGEVLMDGVDPVFMFLEPEEIFFRAFRGVEFDMCELSLSSFSVKTANGDNPYVGVPVFPSRAFRHTAIYVRTDRIKSPADLRGKRIGTPEWQLTACVWARAILEDDHGVKPSEMSWVRAGIEMPGRIEKITLKLPPEIRIENADPSKTLNQMLLDGEIDGMIAPRAPSCFERRAPNIGYLFPDTVQAASEYYQRTKIFPIMHVLGIRRTLVDQHPWLPMAALKAFTASKTLAMHRLIDPSASKVTLPFIEEAVQRAQALIGADWWSYGLDANHALLNTFLGHHHAQGLSSRRLKPEDLFHPSTAESFRI
jgi:4,5-dihydroxyphthalate decarboxylase